MSPTAEYGDFSVIISFYLKDRTDWAVLAMDSIIDQSLKPREIVITIDGPIQDSLSSYLAAISERDQNIRFTRVEFAENRGRGEILAEAVKVSQFPLIAIMDADDISNRDRFATQIDFFAENPGLGVLGSAIEEFDQNLEKQISIKSQPVEHEEIKKYATWRNPINQMTVMFRRDDALKAGNYQDAYLLEDYWLWLRMIHTGSIFHNLSTPLVKVRSGEEQIKRRRGRQYLKSEMNLARASVEQGLYDRFHARMWLTGRIVIRLLPTRLVKLIYKYILRR